MIHYTCPAPDRWSAMLTDDLPADEQLDLQCHLEECPDCQRTLEACAADRDSWTALPRFLARGRENESTLRAVIDRLKLDPDRSESIDSTDMTLDFLDPSDRTTSLGRLGSYEVIGEIGRGGMGVVLKALDPALHRVVAIKVLAPQLAVSGSARKRFTREARAAAAVCHEHVVTIHAVEEFKGLPYLVMHYVAGQSLQQKLNAKGPLPLADILRIGMQSAYGLSAAHAQGLVHRDVKPANILLENGVERVRLSDFGLARAIDDAAVTQSGVITGTPQYMAPEQARGEPLDARADLFSLGSVLYAMAAGKAPFRGANPLDVLRRVNDDTPPPLRQQNPDIPAWLEAIIAKLMAKNPMHRFASATEVSDLLERCLAHVQNPTAVPLPTVPGHVPPRRRHPLAYAAVIALGLFVVSEATGFTQIVQLAATVLRLKTPEGTLVVEIDDPNIKVALDDKDLVITGAGVQEIRLKPGSYTVRSTKGGQTKSEIVHVSREGKTTVKVSFEAAVAVSDVPRFTMNFRDVPWNSVLDWFVDAAKLPLVGQLKPRGTFTFIAPNSQDAKPRTYTLTEMIDILNDALMQQHMLLVRRANSLIVVPTDEKIDPSLFSDMRIEDLATKGRTELVAVVYPLKHVRAESAAQSVRKFIGPFGEVFAGTGASGDLLVVREMVGSLERVQRFLADYDVKPGNHDPGPSNDRAPAQPTGQLVTKPRFQFPTTTGEQGRVAVFNLAITPDGKRVITSNSDGTTNIWDAGNGKLVFTLTHQRQPTARMPMAVSADGKLIATGNRDRSITLDEVSTGRSWTSLFGHKMRPVSMAFSPDGKHLVSGAGGFDQKIGELRVWSVAASREVQNVPNLGSVMSLAFAPDGKSLFVGCGDGSVQEFEYRDGSIGNVVRQLQHSASVNRLAFDPSGFLAAAFGEQGEWCIWDFRRGKSSDSYGARRSATGLHEKAITSLAFSPDGKFVASASTDKTAKLASVDGSGQTQIVATFVFKESVGTIWSAVFTPDGKEIITAGNDGIVRIWDIQPFRASGKLPPGETKNVESTPTQAAKPPPPEDLRGTIVRLDKDLATISVGSDAGVNVGHQLHVYRLEPPEYLGEIDILHTTPNQAVGRLIGQKRNRVKVNDKVAARLAPGRGVNDVPDAPTPPSQRVTKPRSEIGAGAGNVLNLSISADQQRLFFADTQGYAEVRNIPKERIVFNHKRQYGGYAPYAITRDGNLVATVEPGGRIELWDTTTNKLKDTIPRQGLQGIDPGRSRGMDKLAFSPDGRFLINGASLNESQGELRIWDLAGKQGEHRFAVSAQVRFIAFASDGRSVFAACALNEILQINVDDGVFGTSRKIEHPNATGRMAVDPTGRLLAVAYGKDGMVALWDQSANASTRESRGAFRAHTTTITSLAFSPDGKSLLTTSLDGTARLTSISDPGNAIEFVPDKPVGKVWAATFAADGKEVVTISEDGLIRFWDIPASPEPAPQVPQRNSLPVQTIQLVNSMNGAAISAEASTAVVLETVHPRARLQVFDIEKGKASTPIDFQATLDAMKVSKDFLGYCKLAMSADGKLVAAIMGDQLRVWNSTTGKQVLNQSVHSGEIGAVAFGAGGKLVATLGRTDETVRVWDFAAGREVRQFQGIKKPALILAFSADGSKLMASSSSEILLLDLATGDRKGFAIPEGDWVWGGAITPKGEVIAAARSMLFVWDPATASGKRQFKVGQGSVGMPVLVADGRRMLIAQKNYVRVWDLTLGREEFHVELAGHINALSAAPDGKSFTAIVSGANGPQIVTYAADLSIHLRNGQADPPIGPRQ